MSFPLPGYPCPFTFGDPPFFFKAREVANARLSTRDATVSTPPTMAHVLQDERRMSDPGPGRTSIGRVRSHEVRE